MVRAHDLFHRGTSAAVALLTVGVSLAVPLLERDVVSSQTVIESHHDASRCAHAHDHRVCTQVGANLSLTPAESSHRLAHLQVRTASPTELGSGPGRWAVSGPHSRAPPLA